MYLFYGGTVFLAVIIIYMNFNSSKEDKPKDVSTDTRQNISEVVESKNEKQAEKIQIFLFHATNRCYSCTTIGKYTKETVEEFFQPELRNGTIEFREVNIDLSENKELAKKFQATGSSLFINSIIEAEDNIEEDATVWRLVSNEKDFKDYILNKIKQKL